MTSLKSYIIQWVSGHSSLRWLHSPVRFHSWISFLHYSSKILIEAEDTQRREIPSELLKPWWLSNFMSSIQTFLDFAGLSFCWAFISWIRQARRRIIYYNYNEILEFMISLWSCIYFYHSTGRKFQSGVGSQCAKPTKTLTQKDVDITWRTIQSKIYHG